MPIRKIITIEDPIEYQLRGVNQIQVSEKSGLTFARGLRSILRHDPDVILVGEIRDQETAQIAVQASLTGHLVFSTLHTNDAPGALTRLVDMNVEPYLVASSLEAVLAQRLVRVLCPDCKVEDTSATTAALKEQVGFPRNVKVFRSASAARNAASTGYHGRHAIFEWMDMNNEIRAVGFEELPPAANPRGRRSQRHASLSDDGWRLVRLGITTLEEVMRVTKDQTLSQRQKRPRRARGGDCRPITPETHAALSIQSISSRRHDRRGPARGGRAAGSLPADGATRAQADQPCRRKPMALRKKAPPAAAVLGQELALSIQARHPAHVGEFHPAAFQSAGRGRAAEPRPGHSLQGSHQSRSRPPNGRQIYDSVVDGMSLADSMAKIPETFPRVYVAMVQAGETGGFLDLVLAQIADFQAREKDLRSKVMAAMLYPVILLVPGHLRAHCS